jgi:hypothetical protein
MPIRANMVGAPADVATRIRASMAACHSAASWLALESPVMYCRHPPGDERAAAGQRYRLVERSLPAAISRHAAA